LPKDLIDLRRDGITHGTISFRGKGSHFNRHNAIGNVGILAGGSHHVLIGYLVEVELIVGASLVLGLEVDRIIPIPKYKIAQLSLRIAILCVVTGNNTYCQYSLVSIRT
jgi:hypothetical protein